MEQETEGTAAAEPAAVQAAPDHILRLVAQYNEAKTAEDGMKERRIQLEQEITAATGFKKPEGQESYEFSCDEGKCKFTLKQPITTNVDDDEWLKIRKGLPAKHPGRGVFVAKFSLDTKAAKELQETDKTAWAEISGCITRKPGKIGLELKLLQITKPEVAPAPESTEVTNGN